MHLAVREFAVIQISGVPTVVHMLERATSVHRAVQNTTFVLTAAVKDDDAFTLHFAENKLTFVPIAISPRVHAKAVRHLLWTNALYAPTVNIAVGKFTGA